MTSTRFQCGDISVDLRSDGGREVFNAAAKAFLEDRPTFFNSTFPNTPSGWYRILSMDRQIGGDVGTFRFEPASGPDV